MDFLEIVSKILLLLFLGAAAVIDYRKRELSIFFIGGGFLIGFVFQCIIGKKTVLEIILGMLIGGVIIVLSKLTKEAIGMGDGLMLVATGAFLGIIDNLILLLWSTVIAGVWAIGLLVIKKLKRNKEFAFVPFMLSSYVLMLALY